MLLRVVHETAYRYVPPARTAQHMTHLKPRDDERQELLQHRLTIEPAPTLHSESVDVFGNSRTFFALPSEHDSLRIVADSIVRTSASPAPDSACHWEDARERMRYRRGGAWDPAVAFTFGSVHVPRDAQFAAYAESSFTEGRPLLAAARELMERIHQDFRFDNDATHVGTSALEALSLRRGVCQDFAHVMLGCLRSLGLPARYVSGYLLTSPPPGQPTRPTRGSRCTCLARPGPVSGRASTRPTTGRQARITWCSPPVGTTRTCRRCAACCTAAPITACAWA
jgi:transglutaminase-like putative cysteine protease